MSKYRVVKTREDLYLLQKKTIFGTWKTIYKDRFEVFVINKYYEKAKVDFKPEQIIMESE